MCSFKAQVAGNNCSTANICNVEAVHFSPAMHVHEQIRGALTHSSPRAATE
jgi:hypothetical protein